MNIVNIKIITLLNVPWTIFAKQKLFNRVRKLFRYAHYFYNNIYYYTTLIYYTTLDLWITPNQSKARYGAGSQQKIPREKSGGIFCCIG